MPVPVARGRPERLYDRCCLPVLQALRFAKRIISAAPSASMPMTARRGRSLAVRGRPEADDPEVEDVSPAAPVPALLVSLVPVTLLPPPAVAPVPVVVPIPVALPVPELP